MRSVSLILILLLIGLVGWTCTDWFPPGHTGRTNIPAENNNLRPSPIESSSPEEQPPAPAAQPVIAAKPVASSGALPPHSGISSPDPSPGNLLKKDHDFPAGESGETQEAINRLVIPSLRVDAKVVFVPFDGSTWDLADLAQDVAWLGNMPGQDANKNIVLAGHVTVGNAYNGPFRYLSRLAPSAKVIVYTEKKRLTYQVRELVIVKPGDVSAIQTTTHSQLTLLTCTTWDEKTKSYLQRQVVFADLVKVESNSKQELD